VAGIGEAAAIASSTRYRAVDVGDPERAVSPLPARFGKSTASSIEPSNRLAQRWNHPDHSGGFALKTAFFLHKNSPSMPKPMIVSEAIG